MPVGARQLIVIGEFKPFGLIAEALDGGKSPENAQLDYHYFIFDRKITCERDASAECDPSPSDSCSLNSGDHELFIRGNRMIWSTGSRVLRRYTSCSSIIKACWCRMDAIPAPLLCVLHPDMLTIYSSSGEISSIPLPHSVASIWPLPFGLLIERITNESHLQNLSFQSSSPLLNARDFSHLNRECVSTHCNASFFNSSAHLILRHPLEELQAFLVQGKGEFSSMKDHDERIIWTSDLMPLVASYHEGEMQHSIWLVKIIDSNCGMVDSSARANAVTNVVSSKGFILQRIWQGKYSQSAASKVFLATDDDGVPIICFLLQGQKSLFCMRLQISESNGDNPFDINVQMDWSISAVAAADCLIVTRPGMKAGLLPFADIIVLTSGNELLLYSGRQRLCRYYLPSVIGKALNSSGIESHDLSCCNDRKIVGLADALGSKINVIVNNGQIFRCALRRIPSSSLTDDCISSMAEGLHPSFYNHFILLLWGDGDSDFPSCADSCTHSEWESFSIVIRKLCRNASFKPQKFSNKMTDTSWDFLLNSKFHLNYCRSTLKGLYPARKHDSGSYDCFGILSVDEVSQEKSFYPQFLMQTLDSLHALYESMKLDNHRKRDLGLLAALLCNVASAVGETSFVDHYLRDFPYLFPDEVTCSASSSRRVAPCLFRWLENCLRHGCPFANANDLPPLFCKDGNSVVGLGRKIVSFYSLLLGAKRIGRRLSTGVYCSIARGSASVPEELTVLAMVAEKFGLRQLDLLPAGVSLPLRHVLERCRESPPLDWPVSAYVLVGRQDLALSCLGSSHTVPDSYDCLNLVSLSVPYMLHLNPVIMPSSVSDITGLDGGKVEDTESLDGNVADGMDHIFNASTQLRFGHDTRLNEVRRLLCSAKPVAIQSSVNPSTSDQDAQQAQLWQLAQRTTALPFGRGAFTLATTCTLLTEALAIPKLVLAGRLPAQQNATVNLDPACRNLSEVKAWPDFHNGLAAGLRLAPFQEKMSRTWISYNKPEEFSSAHGGLLLALGLHGHLRVLTISDAYKYLSQENEFTTVGILLGMAASHRGTMQPAISKTLYLHITSRHPNTFPDLELPSLLQSAALLAVGLLYEGSAHPTTMKVLMGEIGRRSGGDNVLEREGYVVAAGSALGLVALGQGSDSFGVMNSQLERLFLYAGSKEYAHERLPNVAQNMHDCSPGQTADGAQVNIDVTAPGATIALALIFLKTESASVASRLSIPQTHFDLQYVRPDFIMLRVIARSMIMWSRVYPSREWVESQIPEVVKIGAMSLKDDMSDGDEVHTEALVQAYVNIVAGACISLGLRYAGTRNLNVQELLYEYAMYLLNEIKPIFTTSRNDFPKGLSKYVDRCTLETCLHLIVLSLAVVMSGSGHLQTFRLLRFLRCRNSSDGHTIYGIQMAVSMAIGFLFLGGGMRTFSTADKAIAALLIALYPRLPNGPNDNRSHLQAFRHFYVLATEARWVQTVDVDTSLPVHVPLEITVENTVHHLETTFNEVTPCILPERSELKIIKVCGPRYWPQVIELFPEEKDWWRPGDKNDPFNGGLLYVKRKGGSYSHLDGPIGCQSLLSQTIQVCDPPSLIARTGDTNSPFHSCKTEHMISTFSANPSLAAFGELCCNLFWHSRSDLDLKEFSHKVLFECISMDRPALLQVYLSLYSMIGSMKEEVIGGGVFNDSLFISSLKMASAYSESAIGGKPIKSGLIIESAFVSSLGKQVEEILNNSQVRDDLLDYLGEGKWPNHVSNKGGSMILSWYLQWFDVPPPHVVRLAVEKIKMRVVVSSAVPLLRILLPTTHITVLEQINDSHFS